MLGLRGAEFLDKTIKSGIAFFHLISLVVKCAHFDDKVQNNHIFGENVYFLGKNSLYLGEMCSTIWGNNYQFLV